MCNVVTRKPDITRFRGDLDKACISMYEHVYSICFISNVWFQRDKVVMVDRCKSGEDTVGEVRCDGRVWEHGVRGDGVITGCEGRV